MWLEQQSQATRERINDKLRRFKMQFAGLEITGEGKIVNQIMMDFDDIGEFIEIPVFNNEEREDFER